MEQAGKSVTQTTTHRRPELLEGKSTGTFQWF
jgi:hypothetical protein